MHWGVRKDTRATRKRYNSYNKGMKLLDRHRLKKMTSSQDRQKYLDDKDKKWIENVKDDKKIHKVSKRTAKEMKKVNKLLKEEFGGNGIKGNAKRAMDGRLNAEYMKEMKANYQEVLADHTFAVYKMSPSRTREVEIKALSDGTLKATIVERDNPKLTKQRNAIVKATNKTIKRSESLKHSSEKVDTSSLDGMFFIITLDEDGFPDDVIPPFDSDDDTIQQSGVKGMRWGVRHDKPKSGKLGKHMDSLKRERQWKTVLKDVHNMDTKEIKMVTSRLNLENSFKGLSKSKMATKKDKEDYLRRHEMSDQELARKISRITAKNKLHEAVRNATKEQRDFGIKVAQVSASLGLSYVKKGRKPGLKDIGDIIDIVKDPVIKTRQNAWDEAVPILETKVSNPKAKKAIGFAKKHVKFKTKEKKK